MHLYLRHRCINTYYFPYLLLLFVLCFMVFLKVFLFFESLNGFVQRKERKLWFVSEFVLLSKMSQLLKTQRKKFPYSYWIINTSMKLSIQTFLFKISNFIKCREKNWIKLLNNKYFCENFNLNFSLQNKQLQQIEKHNFTK